MSDGVRAPGVGALSVWPLSPWFLTTPPEERGTIPRARVVQELDDALATHRIVSVSAPSGYGKSTAVAEWARRTSSAVAWLTLTRFDGDAERIALGVAGAARRALTKEGMAAFDRIAVDAAHPETLVDALAHALTVSRQQLVVVVDQAEFASPAASGALGALALTRVPGLHLIVVSTKPASALHAALGHGIEAASIGVDQLSFDADELAALAQYLCIDIDEAAVAGILERTRGWPIAVRLAFGGADTAVLRDLDEYIDEEVLAQLPADLRDIVRATTTVGSLDAELAVALSGVPSAAALLETCVQLGLFLDRFSRDGHRVYVWHEAFRTAVVASEERADPAGVRARHERAAQHLEAQHPLAAVEQFLAAGLPEEAYRLLLESWLEILQTGHVAALDRLLVSLPRTLSDRAAPLRIRACCAWAARDAAGARLLTRRSEDAAADTSVEHATVAIAAMLTTDDPAALRDAVQRTDDALGHPGAVSTRATAHVLFSLGYAGMRLRRAPIATVPTLRSALREARAQGRVRLEARVSETLAFALAFAGDLSEALEHADQVPPLQDDDEWRVYDGGGAACTRGFVAYWRDDLATARSAFDDVRRLAIGPTAFEPVARMYDALAAAASTDLEWQTDALERLKAMPADVILGVPWYGFRDCALAELALARGRLDDAARYAERSMDMPDYLPVPRAMAAETLRRAGDLSRARAVVVSTAATDLTRPAQVRLAVTDALLRDAAAREDAHIVLEKALDLAAPEQIIRPFVSTLPEVQGLLQRHATWGTRHGALIAEALARSAATSGLGLSSRELEVLSYLRTPMTLAEIAATLFLSTNTVKTHVQSLYRKLGVQNRREAVRVRL